MSGMDAAVAKMPFSGQDLASLVRSAQGGAEGALEEIVFRYRDRIARFVRARLHSDDSIEDICHSVLLSVITGLAGLKDPESFEAWLFRIARNNCFESVRRDRLRRRFVPFEPKHERYMPAPSKIDEKVEEFKTTIHKMPRSQKQLIMLLLENDWSYEELAGLTDTTVSSVRSRLFRAREFLRQSAMRQ